MPLHSDDVTVVTVTYGYRWDLLRQALASARREGAARAVVVDNGSEQDIASVAAWEFGKFVNVVTLPGNCGSAGGFKAGMEVAKAIGGDFILLLDDDNAINPGTLQLLQSSWRVNSWSTDDDSHVELGYRPAHHPRIAAGMHSAKMNSHPNSFFGFRVIDTPSKILQRISYYQSYKKKKSIQSTVELNVAPYSGMYFHNSLVAKHGYPDSRFILYADDTEYTHRITTSGGRIYLNTVATLSELETSWNVNYKNSVQNLLLGLGDKNAYYSTRNQAYFERHCRKHKPLVRQANKYVYMGIMVLAAKIFKRENRMKIIREAISDGEACKLGFAEKFEI